MLLGTPLGLWQGTKDLSTRDRVKGKRGEKKTKHCENPPRIGKATRTLPELAVVVYIELFYGILCCLIEERKWIL